MHALIRTSILALAALAMTAGTAAAQGRSFGHHGGGHFHHGGHWGHDGRFWGGVGLGIGIGLGPWYYGAPWYPGYVVVPGPMYEVTTVPSAPAARAPDPVIYPRNGQSAEQTEADRRACDRWAMSQPSAMAEASIFHRATTACMEGRGYTVR
jgi:hypothetical protein